MGILTTEEAGGAAVQLRDQAAEECVVAAARLAVEEETAGAAVTAVVVHSTPDSSPHKSFHCNVYTTLSWHSWYNSMLSCIGPISPLIGFLPINTSVSGTDPVGQTFAPFSSHHWWGTTSSSNKGLFVRSCACRDSPSGY